MSGVQLKFRDHRSFPDARYRQSWTGFAVECVEMNTAREFEYDWEGGSHYLAVHDIVLSDGEVAVAGQTDARQIDLRGRLTFVPQAARVCGWSRLVEGSHGYTAMFFDPGLAEAEYARPLFGAAPRPLLYFEDVRLRNTLERVKRLVTREDETDLLAAETLGLLAVLQLFPCQDRPIVPISGQLTLSQQRRLRDFVEARLSSVILLSEMAELVGLSRYHFARSFARTYGRPPHQYLLSRRISLAASMLATGSLPIAEIAGLTGFASPARLSTAFKRITGRSPRSFRQVLQ